MLELEVVLADGSRATFGALDEAEWARRAQADTLEGAIRRGLPGIAERHARAIAEDYPRHWRQSGGYRLDRFAASGGLDLAQLVTGSEGTLVAITAATVRLVELPHATMFAVGHFDSLRGRDRRHPGRAAISAPASIEMIDRTILGLSRSKLEYRRLADMLEGDPEALLFVSFTGDSEAETRAKLDELEARLARARPRLPHAARRDDGRPGRADQGAQGRARAC